MSAMNLERHHRNYDLHSWSRVAQGLFIFVVCFTGCLALFDAELHAWEDTHKVLGLWGLPFCTIIAVTGAIIRVVTLLAPVIAVLTDRKSVV